MTQISDAGHEKQTLHRPRPIMKLSASGADCFSPAVRYKGEAKSSLKVQRSTAPTDCEALRIVPRNGCIMKHVQICTHHASLQAPCGPCRADWCVALGDSRIAVTILINLRCGMCVPRLSDHELAAYAHAISLRNIAQCHNEPLAPRIDIMTNAPKEAAPSRFGPLPYYTEMNTKRLKSKLPWHLFPNC